MTVRAYGRRRRESDPTRTLTLRNAFARNMRRRFTRLTRDIVSAIVADDCFGLKEEPTITALEERISPGKKAFAFSMNHAKIESFINWIKELQKRRILNILEMPQLGEAIHERWTDVYLESAYAQGISRATAEMRTQGMDIPTVDREQALGLMREPIHADRVAVIYTRAYSQLKGITEVMDVQISQILAQGLLEGKGARDLADDIANVLIGGSKGNASNVIGRFVDARRRGELIARTEIIRAHHLGMIQQYRNWGLIDVHVQAEWKTAGDNRVCELCAELEGKIYTLDEIEGLIPYHPNCFIDKQIPIYTSEGWKPIGDVEIGDLVLTHKRRFKKVYALPRHQEQANVVTFKFKGDLNLSMTENHPVLVEGGTWKPAKDCVEGEKIMLLGNTCNHLGDYQLVPWEVESIKHWKMKRKMPMYNLSVEEDESYVAKGVVVHNCRCLALPWSEEIAELEKRRQSNANNPS